MEYLIDQLIRQGYLKTPRIIKAFREIKREDFVPEDLESEADINAPLPIGYGQTISQPLTVAFMLELLQPEPGDKILDIGSGSGWQTAMLCSIVGDKGFIYAIERISELMEFGEKNVERYRFKNIKFFCKDGSKGLSKEAPFDKIIVAAALDAAEIRRSPDLSGRRRTASEFIPKPWKDQLKVGGRLVTPVGSSIWLLIKKSKDKFEEKEYPGFSFVPLIRD